MEKEEYLVLAVSNARNEHTAIITELLEYNIRVECVETYMECVRWLLDNECHILVIAFPKLEREEFEFIRTVRRMKDFPIMSVIHNETIENKKKCMRLAWMIISYALLLLKIL